MQRLDIIVLQHAQGGAVDVAVLAALESPEEGDETDPAEPGW